jgi:hypothetical protein
VLESVVGRDFLPRGSGNADLIFPFSPFFFCLSLSGHKCNIRTMHELMEESFNK